MAAPQQPTRQTRPSLRRRILLIVLGLSVLPGITILVATTITGVRAFSAFSKEGAKSNVFSRATRLADRIQSEVTAVGRTAVDPGLRELIDDEKSSHDQSSVVSTFLSDPARVVLIGTSGGDLARLGIDGIAAWGSTGLTGDAESDLAAACVRAPSASLFGVESTGAALDTERFWLFARIPVMGSGGDAVWLICNLDPVAYVESDRGDAVATQFPVGLATFSGWLAARGTRDEDLLRILQADREPFDATNGFADMPGNSRVTYCYMRIGAWSTLAEQGGQESVLLTVQRLELDDATAALIYGVWRIAVVGILFIALVGMFGIWLSGRLIDPIIKLRAGFQRLERGDLDYRVDVTTGDELEELATSMNKMAGTLQETYRNLADKLLELDQKARQLAMTYQVANALNRSLDLETLFNDIINEFRQLVPADLISLGLVVDGDPSVVKLAHTWPANSLAFQQHARIDLANSLSKMCIESGHLGLFPLHKRGDSDEERLLADSGMVTLCVIPLITTTELVGLLLVADSDDDAFRRMELEVVQRVSLSLATAVEHSSLYARQAGFATELERKVLERTAELRLAQDQLLQSERFAAAGELAANMAHEINNPLSIIMNYLKLLQGQLLRPPGGTENSEVAREGLTIIGEEIDRIARIVDQLRKVHAPMTPQVRPVEINRELAQLVQLFRHTFHQKSLHVETNFDPNLGEVSICSDYLRQIVINLLRNAYDATEAGGSIVISSRLDHARGGKLVITVRDTGHGIPEEVLGKIFNPFFTTKKDGKGSGLGLSVSYGLARNMGGTIRARSRPGEGSEFEITLPFAPPDGPAAEQRETGIQRVGYRIIIG